MVIGAAAARCCQLGCAGGGRRRVRWVHCWSRAARGQPSLWRKERKRGPGGGGRRSTHSRQAVCQKTRHNALRPATKRPGRGAGMSAEAVRGAGGRGALRCSVCQRTHSAARRAERCADESLTQDWTLDWKLLQYFFPVLPRRFESSRQTTPGGLCRTEERLMRRPALHNVPHAPAARKTTCANSTSKEVCKLFITVFRFVTPHLEPLCYVLGVTN